MRNCTAFKKSNSNNLHHIFTYIYYIFISTVSYFCIEESQTFCITFWLQTKNKTFEIDALLLKKSQRHLLFDKNWLKGKR